jgi:hypothetical protein
VNVHAVLAASSASRWLNCPPSARLELAVPEGEGAVSRYAEEGTQAHALAEAMLRAEQAKATPIDKEKAKALIAASPLEMVEAVREYYDLCLRKIKAARDATPDAKILLEEQLDFSPWVPEGFGTGDLVIVADGMIEIIDLKYGKGVPVSAQGNPQMRLYALGAVNAYGMLYATDAVTTTIVQPRLYSVSSETLRVDFLLEWGEHTVGPLARQAFAGQGEFCAGEHCRFCRAHVKCPARAQANLELIRFDFKQPDLLSNEDIGLILGLADHLQAWTTDIQHYALAKALGGTHWPGYKLVEGKRMRRYLDADKAAETLIAAGYPDAVLFERKLLGITAMEKAIGKKSFAKFLKELVAIAPGAPTLAPESDKRPAFDRRELTRNEFEEVTTHDRKQNPD